MGGCCCCYRADGEGPHEDEDDLNPFEQHLKDALQPLPPPDPLAYAKMPPHIFIMGPPSVGKTSLFMRWAYPDIDPDDAVGVVSETSTFHCESAMLFDRKCFLWDVSHTNDIHTRTLTSFLDQRRVVCDNALHGTLNHNVCAMFDLCCLHVGHKERFIESRLQVTCDSGVG
eukprot:Blabericola_migrator_1__8375@NODE_435_length_8501_cov_292_016244_g341_i0_p6_GENE_NODE_435_length_8501_cov_292_016244_g341_i0NODE_435_length_8501_cov_292_016244_g341_i0_p6_ORF_typecomplete_len171_score19_50Roc/PF08477_13/0_001AAA_28/PF13521_6/7_7e03AAA_28/PF13521_6/0_01FtsK_SpoIIIE/PF01580_18/0_031RuvB_N/PF05496_12/0_049RuvB_N/PF05496_12/1_1e04Herpes_ori_bp/PF02399_15/0_036MMR_HSR1/PF01926_23/0_054AAA_16/PF13191_6/0_1Arf/PF00025_21/0_06TrwB_AAD_bind/PF10412_9/0_064ATPase_2/PF01637_18/0_094TniB/PF